MTYRWVRGRKARKPEKELRRKQEAAWRHLTPEMRVLMRRHHRMMVMSMKQAVSRAFFGGQA